MRFINSLSKYCWKMHTLAIRFGHILTFAQKQPNSNKYCTYGYHLLPRPSL